MHWLLENNACLKAIENFPTALLYGYSVYTTFRWPLPKHRLQAHLQRLAHDAKAIGLAWESPDECLIAQIQQLVQPDTPVVRLTAMADVNGYVDLFDETTKPARLLLSTRPAPAPTKNPLKLQTAAYERPLATIKLGAMAEVIHFKQQALRSGFDDVLLINRTGNVSEASTANIFLIRGNCLLTPEPERDRCLPGITRAEVLDIAGRLGLATETSSMTPADFAGLDGAFLTNAVQGIQMVGRIDAHAFPWPKAAQEKLTTLQAILAKI